MKSISILIALGAIAASPVAASAAGPAEHNGAGHYEWRSVPEAGPRPGAPVMKRVWVADNAQTASCDCHMMKMSSADCMMNMRSRANPRG